MNEPRLTEQVEADLVELWAYIAANHPKSADRVVDTILERSRLHVRFPGMGLSREELRPGLRCSSSRVMSSSINPSKTP